MIIIMQKQAAASSVAAVVEFIRSKGLREHISPGAERTIIGAVGDERVFLPQELESLPQVSAPSACWPTGASSAAKPIPKTA